MEAGDIGAGDTLGPYELLVPLAQGGMAAVWAARSASDPQRVVALKMMLADLAEDDDSRSMLRDEAANVALLRHPNVAEMIDVGEVNDVLYLVMEWIDGETLNVLSRAAAKAGQMPIDLAVAIVKQVANGLHAAHELNDADGIPMNLVHRDVSPQNILVGYDGVVKVIDFGVAKASNNMHQTTVGQLKGKASFMAPEQTRGQPVDRRTDVFALGTVLYQLLTGKHPFPADNEFAVMLRIADAKPAAPLRSVREDCPEALERVVATALEKSKEARYSSMLELSRALEAAVPRAPRSPVVLASFMREHLGARGERRRDALRQAMALADQKNPGERVEVDMARISRASERPATLGESAGAPPSFDDMLRGALDHEPEGGTPPSRALARGPAGALQAIAATRDPAAAPASAPTYAAADNDDPARFKNRSAPALVLLAVFALLALVYFGLRD